ncbi:myotrophin-like isoform X2 [Watersipora subatra]|uniref:myotrophin-like isoform X2 n=1 Tax=Watersipora subatra TaxID=2589382 RepID=UPI00355AD9C9
MSGIVWSVKNGDLKAVMQMGASVNEMSEGRYPLHFAADYGQLEVLNYLISKGADVNAEDKYGITPLLSAIFEGHESCVEALLKKGADKNKKHDGRTYYECAETDAVKLLLK